jgi:hypothetical protein
MCLVGIFFYSSRIVKLGIVYVRAEYIEPYDIYVPDGLSSEAQVIGITCSCYTPDSTGRAGTTIHS